MKPEIKQKVKKAIKILNRGFIIFIILGSFTGAILYAGGYKSYLRHYVKKEYGFSDEGLSNQEIFDNKMNSKVSLFIPREDKSIWIDGEEITSGWYYFYYIEVGDEYVSGLSNWYLKPIATRQEYSRYLDEWISDIGDKVEAEIGEKNYAVTFDLHGGMGFYNIIKTYDDFLEDYNRYFWHGYVFLPKDITDDEILQIHNSLMKYKNVLWFHYILVEDSDIEYVKTLGKGFDWTYVKEEIEDYDQYSIRISEMLSKYLCVKQDDKVESELGSIDFVLDYGTANEKTILNGYDSLAGYYDLNEVNLSEEDSEEIVFVFEDDYKKEIDEIVDNNIGHTISILKNNRCISSTTIQPSLTSGTLLMRWDDFWEKDFIELFYPKYYEEVDYEERHTRSSPQK